MKDLLGDLVATPGVSGGESGIGTFIKHEIDPYVDEIEIDDFQNVIARKGDGDRTLMVMAHMDQIGLSVKNVTEDGDIEFAEIGGVQTESLYNQHVTVHGEQDVPGVIGIEPPHGDDEGPDPESLYVDIGAESPDDVYDLGIEKGDYITYDRNLTELQNDYVSGPALDNRVGCAVAMEALKRFDGDYELVTVFSTQEEVGLKGAKTASFDIDPDAALAIDVSKADGDTEIEMGEGVDIQLMQKNGRGIIVPEKVRDWLTDTADLYGHDYQRSMMDGGRTDASRINLVRDGIPTGSIGVPTNYMHSATETVRLDDMEGTVDYLEDVYGEFERHF